jgi:hypothetical protein
MAIGAGLAHLLAQRVLPRQQVNAAAGILAPIAGTLGVPVVLVAISLASVISLPIVLLLDIAV